MTLTDAGSLLRIGPIPIYDRGQHRNPSLRWTSNPGAHGIRTCVISGQAPRASVLQLGELVANADRRLTIAGFSGVLEFLSFDGELVGPFRGWYLLTSIDVAAERPWSITTYTPFSLQAAYLGDVANLRVVVEHAARSRGNDFGIIAQEVVAGSFWDENAAGGTFATEPGGTRFTREYDETGAWPGVTPAPVVVTVDSLITQGGDFMTTEGSDFIVADMTSTE